MLDRKPLRTKAVLLRLSAYDHKELVNIAKKHGITFNGLARAVLGEVARKRIKLSTEVIK